jgi:hypothetical protein
VGWSGWKEVGDCSYSNMLMFWCPHKNLLLSAVGTCEGLHDSSMRNNHRKTVMQVLCCVVVREQWLSCRVISRARSFRMRMAPLTILACPVHCCRLSSHWGAASRSHVEWRTQTTQTPSWSSWTVPMSPALGEFFHPCIYLTKRDVRHAHCHTYITASDGQRCFKPELLVLVLLLYWTVTKLTELLADCETAACRGSSVPAHTLESTYTSSLVAH